MYSYLVLHFLHKTKSYGGFVLHSKIPRGLKCYTIKDLHIKQYYMWFKCYIQNLKEVFCFTRKLKLHGVLCIFHIYIYFK